MSLTCDDPDEDWALEAVRLVRPDDRLTPAPPNNWWLVGRLPPAMDREAVHVGIWALLLSRAQNAKSPGGARQHRIARDPAGASVLVVHPDLSEYFGDLMDDFDSRLRTCDCGGSECLDGEIQNRWFARRIDKLWKSLWVENRLQLLRQYDCSGDPEEVQELAEDDQLFAAGNNVEFFEWFADWETIQEVQALVDEQTN